MSLLLASRAPELLLVPLLEVPLLLLLLLTAAAANAAREPR
jgi:hypothetical protein